MNKIKKELFTISIFLAYIALFSYYQMQNITDPDIPWHIATGGYIIKHHLIPHQDVFSWTALGTKWVTQEWLYEVLLYGITRWLGFVGFFLLGMFFQTGTFWILYLIAKKITEGKKIISIFVAGACIWISHPFWVNRPQSISYLMFSLFIYIVIQYHDNKKKWLYLSPILIFIWSNMHASSLIGVVVILFEIVISCIPSFGSYIRKKMSKKEIIYFAVVAAASLVAGLFTPNGIKTYLYVLLSTNPEMTKNIIEWKSPNFQDPYVEKVILFFIIAVILLLAATKKEKSIRGTLYFIGTLSLSLIHQRFIPYMGIASILGISDFFASIKTYKIKNKFILNKLPIVYSVVILLSVSWCVAIIPQLQGKIQKHLSNESYPIQAVQFMKNHHLTNKVLNYYAWGGYLIFENIPTFIDGRTGIYLKTRLFSKYVTLQNTGDNLTQIIKKYHPKEILFPDGSLLSNQLEASSKWKEVYHDGVADVFVENKKVP